MGLEEQTLEHAGSRCEECGVKLTASELQEVLESNGPMLCAIHAAELVEENGDEEQPGVQ
jgi:hypothetical protein